MDTKNGNNNNTIYRISGIISWGVVIAAVFLALFILSAKVFGGGVYSILSGSMEPELRTGSLVYVLPVDAEKLKEGDVITFALSEDLTATHRIVAISKEGQGADGGDGELWFTTKGDANSDRDAAPVSEKNVIGKPVMSVPLLGYLITYIKSPPWIYIAVITIVVLAVLSLLPKRHKNSR